VARAAANRAAPGRALARDAERIVRAAADMATRLRRGGRVLTFGDGAAAADAGHLALTFTHPAIAGRPALPAISLAGDASALTGIAVTRGYSAIFTSRLRLLGRPGDVAVGIMSGGTDTETGHRYGDVLSAFAAARELGMLTIALTQATPRPARDGWVEEGWVDHVLAARCDDPRIARETHITACHLLWELTHVFLDTPAPARRNPPACDAGTGTACVTCADTAVPVHVTELRPGGLALVDTGAGTEEVSVALVEARVGDVVLVHAKEAIAVLGGDGP
jgi:D-sedoheptulose 7-phosphate isomerase